MITVDVVLIVNVALFELKYCYYGRRVQSRSCLVLWAWKCDINREDVKWRNHWENLLSLFLAQQPCAVLNREQGMEVWGKGSQEQT